MSVFVAADTGGTFTDLVVFDSDTLNVQYTKSLTTPDDPIRGIRDCVGKIGLDPARVSLFKHGTTHVINTLIERSGPKVALVTTHGFRDILEIGRGNRTETFNLFFRRDPPLVARQLRFEIDERMDAQGNSLIEPRYEQVEELACTLREYGVAGVAVSFINAYREPRHEKVVAEWLRALLPDCYVTAGSELSREWYEFERTMTAVANAYTGPRISGYVGRLSDTLASDGFPGKLLLMGSNGGMISPAHAAAAPILLVESGPVGGCIGAAVFGKALGIDNLIAFDMGGTTAKCALVEAGSFETESTYYAGGYGRGIPIRAPVVDIVEVGAGGGSVAWVNEQERLRVGPRSAGSSPGPIAYGRGGMEPTVTDANLVLGRIHAARFQGGEMSLDVDAAREAIRQRLAEPLGYSGEGGVLEVACGILSIAAVTMADAIKQITVRRGRDPRDFALFAYGGGGPLHAGQLARELRIPLVIIPPEAGNFSALGMLLANVRSDISRTLLHPANQAAAEPMEAVFAEMEEELRASLARDFGDVPVAFERRVEMRFVGQYHAVSIPAADDIATLRANFLDAYKSRYGHAMESHPAELVTLHSVAKIDVAKPQIENLAPANAGAASRGPEKRAVFFPDQRRELETSVYLRRDLPIGFSAKGPAVIEEYGSTTIVGPEDAFKIGPLGELRITIAGYSGTGARQ